MMSSTRILGWIGKACFEGWRTLRRALSVLRPTPKTDRPLRPVITSLPAGPDVRVRLDHRCDPSLSDAGSLSTSGVSAVPADTESERIQRRMEDACHAERSRAEQSLLGGGCVPNPALLQATGTVFQGTVVSSTDPNVVAWVSATPRSP